MLQAEGYFQYRLVCRILLRLQLCPFNCFYIIVFLVLVKRGLIPLVDICRLFEAFLNLYKMVKLFLLWFCYSISTVAIEAQTGPKATNPSHTKITAHCKIIDITKAPGYSDRSRYFNLDRGSSLMLSSKGFGVYLAGPGDGYTWDSIKQCQGKYVVYFANTGSQETLHPVDTFEFQRHHITFLNTVGILYGRYDLLFDFDHNESSEVVPNGDIGQWQISSSELNRIIIHQNKTLEFGASPRLQQYRIDHIKVDRADTSTLYITTQIHTNIPYPNNQQQFLIKHGSKLTILLWGPPPGRPELGSFYVLSRL
jgi:hypothetical protein